MRVTFEPRTLFDPGAGLTVGEGIETCLAARQMGLQPIWALYSVTQIQAFPVLGGVGALTILGESDDSGASRHATTECARRWLAADRDVTVIFPKIRGDMNDVLRAMRRAA